MTSRVTVSVPRHVREEAARCAKEEGISLSRLVSRAVEEHLRERERRAAFERMNELFGAGGVAPDIDDVLQEDRRRSDRFFE